MSIIENQLRKYQQIAALRKNKITKNREKTQHKAEILHMIIEKWLLNDFTNLFLRHTDNNNN